MKNRLSGIPLFYLIFALGLIVTLGVTQARGMRLLNAFTGAGLTSQGHPDAPEHK
jgi:hypothetical protein